MKIAIMQPTYLPWIGYFGLMKAVDVFVVLDNVQFEYQSWQHKNKVGSKNGILNLTVPVFNKGRFGQLIKDVEIDNSRKWFKKHLSSITFNYSKSDFFEQMRFFFEEIYSKKWDNLLELNLEVLYFVKKTLRIDTKIILASELKTVSGKIERIASICREIGAKKYISPVGSAQYINEHGPLIDVGGAALFYFNFDHPIYTQNFSGFTPYLSIVDALFNVGPEETRLLIEKGTKEFLTPKEVSSLINLKDKQ